MSPRPPARARGAAPRLRSCRGYKPTGNVTVGIGVFRQNVFGSQARAAGVIGHMDSSSVDQANRTDGKKIFYDGDLASYQPLMVGNQGKDLLEAAHGTPFKCPL